MRRFFAGLFLVLALPVWAAAPTVRSSISGGEDSGATTHPLTQPATIENGDVVVCAAVYDGTAPLTWNGDETWTSYSEDDISEIVATVQAYVADGSEDSATYTYSHSGGNQESSYICYAVQDWSGTIGTDVDGGTAATGTSTTPDPPSVTAGWGNDDNLVIACAMTDSSLTVSTWSLPDNQIERNSTGGGGVSIACSTDELTTSPHDPGAYTMSASQEWVAMSIVIKPAAAGGGLEIELVISEFRRRRQ